VTDAKYRTIFDLANDAMFLHDARTGAILDVNRKMTELYGYSREEACQLAVAQLSADDAPHTQERALTLLSAAASGTPQLFEWLAKDRAGRLFWVEVSLKQVILDGEDRLLASVRDITERKHAERAIHASHESQKTLNALLRLALADLALDELLQRALALVLHGAWPRTRGIGGVLLVDDEGTLVLASHSGLDPLDASARSVGLAGDCACGPDYYCTPIAAGDTQLGWLKVYVAESHRLDLYEEEFLGAFASTLAGIIVRKRAEQQLRTADEQLREQAALVRLGEMAAVVAHEVKNPLAAVRGAIQVIGGRLPPENRDTAVIHQVIARLDALDELMRDMLLFARPPKAQFMAVDIASLARETSELVSRDAGLHEVKFEVHGAAPAVNADPNLMKSVLFNLLLNAAHASQRAATVRTTITEMDRFCCITVADAGPGIPPEIRERIFVPFFTTKARGTGLGLPTAKRLVEAHSGHIRVECPPGGGTVVTIELPRS
jgi:PAS domain S-box-containing protein